MFFIVTLLIYQIALSTAIPLAYVDLTVGSKYEYEVIKSEWKIVHGSKNCEGTGIQLGGNLHPIGAEIEIAITEVIYGQEVSFDITMGEDSTTNTNYANTAEVLYQFLYLPSFLLIINETWDQAAYDLGPTVLFGIFFFDIMTYNQTFTTLDDDPFPAISLPFGGYYNNYGARYEIKNSKGIFNWLLSKGGSPHDGLAYQGGYYATIEFDLSTGVLYGYNMKLDYNGTLDGKILDFYINQKVEAKGYNMGPMYYPKGLPGFDLFITIPSLIVACVIIIYYKKQKNKV